MTLSDFVAEHYRGDVHPLQSPEGIKMLTAKLRGVGVEVGRSKEQRMIMGFKMVAIADLPPRQRHHASPSVHTSPASPLVNVGTLEKPLLVPMQTCRLQEYQLLRGPREAGLTSYVNHLIHKEAAMELPKFCKDTKSSLVVHKLPESSDINARLRKACNRKSPNVLFVEAGSTAIPPKRWSDLRNKLKVCLSQPFTTSTQDADTSMPLLSLRYNPEFDESTLSTKWTRQLRDFVKQHENYTQKTIVIV